MKTDPQHALETLILAMLDKNRDNPVQPDLIVVASDIWPFEPDQKAQIAHNDRFIKLYPSALIERGKIHAYNSQTLPIANDW